MINISRSFFWTDHGQRCIGRRDLKPLLSRTYEWKEDPLNEFWGFYKISPLYGRKVFYLCKEGNLERQLCYQCRKGWNKIAERQEPGGLRSTQTLPARNGIQYLTRQLEWDTAIVSLIIGLIPKAGLEEGDVKVRRPLRPGPRLEPCYRASPSRRNLLVCQGVVHVEDMPVTQCSEDTAPHTRVQCSVRSGVECLH